MCKNTEPEFADDTGLFASGSNVNNLHDKVNSDLAIIAEWVKIYKL